MNPIQSLILGLLQGLTEFIPVSSSGHLVLVPWLLGWQGLDPALNLAFDTALHLGTLVALLVVFRHDLTSLVVAWVQSIRRRTPAAQPAAGGPQSGVAAAGTAQPPQSTGLSTLAWGLIIATIPAVVFALIAGDFLEGLFSAPGPAALFLLITGFLLLLGERLAATPLALERLGIRGAFLVGLAQAVAIVPGISRSGATISGGRLLGLSRTDAARFSFLLSIPAVAGAGVLQAAKFLKGGLPAADQLLAMLAGFLVALLSGYLVIRFLLRYLQRHSLLPFAVYCWLFGGLSLIVWLVR